jgi:16S rRNA (uracil1498-N3)-methyltransferase
LANLYFAEHLDPESWSVDSLLTITGDEARHAVRVSRLRAGEQILVGDGNGVIAEASVEAVANQSFAVRLTQVRQVPLPAPRIVLVQALAKGDRDERAVEQSTEFGADGFVPWQAERSVSRWADADKVAKGVAKWARIAREASKQSLRARVPEVRDPVSLEALCALAASDNSIVVVLHPRGEGSLSGWAREMTPSETSEIYLVVGPEGGLAEGELERLQRAGADVVTLGETVLRTSSAGPAAIAVLSVALGRW